MRITNIHDAPLGFGAERLLPGRTIDTNCLPKGYTENHSLIKFYIRNGWLEVVSPPANGNEQPVSVSVGINIGGNKVDGAGKNDAKTEVKPITNKPISRLNKAELRALATELGIAFTKDDSNPVLIKKIKATKAAEVADSPHNEVSEVEAEVEVETVAERSAGALPDANAVASTSVEGCDSPDA